MGKVRKTKFLMKNVFSSTVTQAKDYRQRISFTFKSTKSLWDPAILYQAILPSCHPASGYPASAYPHIRPSVHPSFLPSNHANMLQLSFGNNSPNDGLLASCMMTAKVVAEATAVETAVEIGGWQYGWLRGWQRGFWVNLSRWFAWPRIDSITVGFVTTQRTYPRAPSTRSPALLRSPVRSPRALPLAHTLACTLALILPRSLCVPARFSGKNRPFWTMFFLSRWVTWFLLYLLLPLCVMSGFLLFLGFFENGRPSTINHSLFDFCRVVCWWHKLHIISIGWSEIQKLEVRSLRYSVLEPVHFESASASASNFF